MTNQFVDTYFNNEALVTQAVQRVISQPDFLFEAKRIEPNIQFLPDGTPYLSVIGSLWSRTDTSAWTNNSALNGNPGGDGPGVIGPPIRIVFHTPGIYVAAAGGNASGAHYTLFNWATFDDSATAPLIHAGNQTNVSSVTLSTRLIETNAAPALKWTVFGREGGVYQVDVSTNLTDWTPLTVITNTSGVFFFTVPVNKTAEYFRAILRN